MAAGRWTHPSFRRRLFLYSATIIFFLIILCIPAAGFSAKKGDETFNHPLSYPDHRAANLNRRQEIETAFRNRSEEILREMESEKNRLAAADKTMSALQENIETMQSMLSALQSWLAVLAFFFFPFVMLLEPLTPLLTLGFPEWTVMTALSVSAFNLLLFFALQRKNGLPAPLQGWRNCPAGPFHLRLCRPATC